VISVNTRSMINRGIRPSTTQSALALWLKSLLNALLFFGIFMVALPYAAHWLLPLALPLPRWLRVVGGGVFFVGGLVLWISCLDVFSRRGHGTPFPLDAPRHLVITGPYRAVRNPIMVGELAVIWGEALFFSSLAVFIYAAVATLAGHLAVIYVEEPEVRERFGEQYEAYCRHVSRWLPWLPNKQSA
jgi:protein-S-isoprenylcysteine O-methyltransferase Ste14